MNAGFFRQTTVLFMVLAIGLALVLFGVKYEVQEMEEELVSLDKSITKERDRIRVLRTEWAFITNPDRLRGLAKAHLDLQPLAPEQVGTFVSLPWPPPPDDLQSGIFGGGVIVVPQHPRDRAQP